MQEYWVNVYKNVAPYCCHKWDSEIAAAYGMSATSYDYPIYRIHVKMKPVSGPRPNGLGKELRAIS